MGQTCHCQNGLTNMELMATLEEMGYDFRLTNETQKDVERDTRSLDELKREDFDWSGAYETAQNEGFQYCSTYNKWVQK